MSHTGKDSKTVRWWENSQGQGQAGLQDATRACRETGDGSRISGLQQQMTSPLGLHKYKFSEYSLHLRPRTNGTVATILDICPTTRSASLGQSNLFCPSKMRKGKAFQRSTRACLRQHIHRKTEWFATVSLANVTLTNTTKGTTFRHEFSLQYQFYTYELYPS